MNISKTVLAILLTFAVALFSASDAQAQGKSGRGGGGGGGGNLAVTVTFEDSPGYRLMSDGKGAYTSAQIDEQGNLAFGFGAGKKKKPGTRKVFFDFFDCASAGCTAPFFDDGGLGSGRTYGNMFTAGVNLRTMGTDETSPELRLYGAIKPKAAENFSYRYSFDPLDDRCPGSTSITVTRTGPDTWVIEAGAQDVLCLRQGGHSAVHRGLYHMPFKMTLQLVSAPAASPTP